MSVGSGDTGRKYFHASGIQGRPNISSPAQGKMPRLRLPARPPQRARLPARLGERMEARQNFGYLHTGPSLRVAFTMRLINASTVFRLPELAVRRRYWLTAFSACHPWQLSAEQHMQQLCPAVYIRLIRGLFAARLFWCPIRWRAVGRPRARAARLKSSTWPGRAPRGRCCCCCRLTLMPQARSSPA